MMRPTTERRSSNNLVLNTSKTKEVIDYIVMDYRRSRRTEHAPLLIHGEAVERVNNIKFLGIHITSDLTWSMNTAHLVKKAQQRLFFLRKLKRAGLSPQLLTNFYRATIESILCLSAALWRRRRAHRKQKRGKSKGGLRARLQANPYRPALPSLFLTNARSLVNKMDEMKLRIISAKIDSCVAIVTETWLDNNIPDVAVELAGRSLLRAVRTAVSEKHRGGDWEMFKEAATYNNLIDVEEYTDTVTSYITKCIDDVTHIKSITTRANRKPWLTGDVHRLLKARDKAFKAGDESALENSESQPVPWHQESKTRLHKQDNLPLQGQQECTEPMAGHSGHYGLQTCTTEL
ncbi:hypothetical protein L3Q82_006316 [Scortum barcoo]|uniref:Uncharacterized protein n=1 Tax=Scortum barcoo TaxID=214431 RepID=A0ACB8X314_9TELE|nr:hypothetical protein L3Q82_006316 [Scortum barcoo]